MEIQVQFFGTSFPELHSKEQESFSYTEDEGNLLKLSVVIKLVGHTMMPVWFDKMLFAPFFKMTTSQLLLSSKCGPQKWIKEVQTEMSCMKPFRIKTSPSPVV